MDTNLDEMLSAACTEKAAAEARASAAYDAVGRAMSRAGTARIPDLAHAGRLRSEADAWGDVVAALQRVVEMRAGSER